MASTIVAAVPDVERIAASATAARLEDLGSAGRRRIYEAGEMSRAERFAWAARYPEEVPMVNGEVEWIARRLADLD